MEADIRLPSRSIDFRAGNGNIVQELSASQAKG